MTYYVVGYDTEAIYPWWTMATGPIPQVIRAWRKWLSRRHRAGRLHWDRMNEILKRHPMPPAKVMRSIYVLERT